MQRRAIITLPLLAMPAMAQTRFPERPIRLIVPWTAGGPADVGFRALSELASRRLGQPVVVENRAGAAGILGALALQEARPDGHAISQMHVGVVRQMLLNPRPPYHPIDDLTYILQITGFIMGAVVRADSPHRSLPELLAHARAHPGRLNYGTLGTGSTQHLLMERIALAQGITWTHAPYRGTADTLRALLGGEIDFASESSGWAPLVQAGQLRLLAVYGSERARRFPDVPTLRELGIDLTIDSPGGLIGPRGMDAGVVRVLAEAFTEAARDPTHLQILERLDQPLLLADGAAYRELMRRTMEEERAVLRQLNMLPA
ncbi:MAG: tripartite tricarboxylate transporter substrate binding protein [Alphaproteobacteria bacterium]|jgi:tripartite-type tricarboxylate transporter receptor subunit TctC|nr:tripartite tricarboxylate transporter substrate binding protein [Alphaproteobacteria bacterium]